MKCTGEGRLVGKWEGRQEEYSSSNGKHVHLTQKAQRALQKEKSFSEVPFT